ncbi:MAG: protein kinase [Xanthomonadales bacterium]|nr:protein kinase [Xanthomonadales bacterium]
MGRDPPATPDANDHQLSEAAERIADGVAVEISPAVPGESGRVLGNLSKLAALRSAFQRLDEAEAASPAGAGDGQAVVPAEWGHLRIVESLGCGGFGTVYRAFDPLLERDVALKLRREDREQPMATRAYIGEARRLARVRHPNVLAVHGAGIHDGRAGLWSDLIEGESLEQRLSHGPLSRTELLALARQLLEAVRAIHRAGLVHGDLKAANVMFDAGHAVLMDFGAAHAPGDRPRQGSVDSMAPELLAGDRGDARSDLYSLGALLYRAALPRDVEPSAEPKQLRSRVGHSFARLIEELTHADPACRPRTDEVSRRLQRIVSAPARRRRRLGVGLVFASLLIGLLASLFALHRVREARERSDRIKGLLVAGIQNAAPTRQSGPASLREMLDFLAEQAPVRLQDYPEALADMRVVVGAGLADLGHLEEGLELAEAGLTVLGGLPDVSSLHLANTYNVIAGMRARASRVLANNGSIQVASARDAATKAIRLYEQLPATSRDRRLGLIRTRSLLGNLLTEEGDWLGAVEAHRSNLADRTALLGASASELAVDEYNLANAQAQCGDYASAEQNFRRAADRLHDAGAGESSRMAYVMHGHAVSLLRLGRQEESAALVDLAEALYHRVLDPQHAAVRRLAIFRAETMRVNGDPERAWARYRKVTTDPGTQEQLNTALRLNGIDILIDLGHYEEARSALDVLREKLRPGDAPLLPYVDAADVWVEARRHDTAGVAEKDPTAATRIRASITAMRDAGYGGLHQVARMNAWADQLDPGR